MVHGIQPDTVKIFEQCYDDYFLRLLSFARARLRENSDCCEDCVQEAFEVFYKRLVSGEQFEYPCAFLYRTLENIIKKQNSKTFAEQKNTVSLDDSENVVELKSEDDVSYESCIEMLEKSLNDKEKLLYTEKYVYGKPIQVIADETGLTVGAVTMRLSRLRQKLKKELENLVL